MNSSLTLARSSWAACLLVSASLSAGCQSHTPDTAAGGVPTQAVYSRETGRLEQLKADADGDGKTDTVAYMDGTRLKYIEIDPNNDGHPDRWEYYEPTTKEQAAHANGFDRLATIVRAEESARPDGQITRREFYDKGLIQRVEEDTNLDGRVDKWEFYADALLTRVDLDVQGKGFPDHRLIYQPDGTVSRVELDPDGDGKFVAAPVEH